MRTITITRYASMPGSFRVEHVGEGKSFGRDASGKGEAAGIALNYANSSSTPYAIVGYEPALDLIPKELHYRK